MMVNPNEILFTIPFLSFREDESVDSRLKGASLQLLDTGVLCYTIGNNCWYDESFSMLVARTKHLHHVQTFISSILKLSEILLQQYQGFSIYN